MRVFDLDVRGIPGLPHSHTQKLKATGQDVPDLLLLMGVCQDIATQLQCLLLAQHLLQLQGASELDTWV